MDTPKTVDDPVVAAQNRKARAQQIVAASRNKITRFGAGWLVPSQNHGGSYFVRIADNGVRSCTCPDWAERGSYVPCKHIFSVDIVETETTSDGSTVTTTYSIKTRRTYGQDWHTYNLAQTNEGRLFPLLLRDLCLTVPQPPRSRGRKPIPLADVIMAAVMKLYVAKSGRRASSFVRELASQGFISRAPSYNSVFRYAESEVLTAPLSRLVTLAASPLVGFEDTLAVDSTGISLRTYAPGYRAKRYGDTTPKKYKGWLKLHCAVGCKSHVIASLRVCYDGQHSADSPEFARLVTDAKANGLHFVRVCADAAYSSGANVQLVEELTGVPLSALIPFRDGTGTGQYAPESFKRAYHFFKFQGPEFFASDAYGQRQAVEGVFSDMKRTIASSVRARNEIAATNEALMIALAHNIRKVIHAAYKFGFEPKFLGLPEQQ